MASNILQFPQQGAPSPAKPTDQSTVNSITQKQPDKVNKSIGLAKDYAKDVIQGSDATTQQIMGKFSEQSAATSSARRGAEAQRAELSGASQSTQNILGQLTNRDIEATKQAGITDMATQLGARADQQAGQLSQIGQFEVSADQTQQQIDAQQEQFDKTMTLEEKKVANQAEQFGITADMNQQEIDAKIQQWGVENGMTQEQIDNQVEQFNVGKSEREFATMLATTDFSDADSVQALNDYRVANGMEPMTFSAMKAEAYDANEAKANKELINIATVNRINYIGEDGTLDITLMKKDPKVMSTLAELWKNENNGTAGEFDPDNPDHMTWADSKLKVATQTASDVDMMNFNEKSATVLSSDAYVNGTEAYKASVDQILADLEQFILLGGTFEIGGDGSVTFEGGDGTVIAESEIVSDPDGNVYTEETDGSVIIKGEDGSTSTFTKGEDGEWISSDHKEEVIEKVDGQSGMLFSEIASGLKVRDEYVVNEDGSLTYTNSDTGEVLNFKKDKDGRWGMVVSEATGSKATEEQLKYIDNATNKEEPDIVEEMIDEVDKESETGPEITKSEQYVGTSTNGQDNTVNKVLVGGVTYPKDAVISTDSGNWLVLRPGGNDEMTLWPEEKGNTDAYSFDSVSGLWKNASGESFETGTGGSTDTAEPEQG